MSDAAPSRLEALLAPVERMGATTLAITRSFGRHFLLLFNTLLYLPASLARRSEIMRQMYTLGIQSMPVVLFFAVFSGFVVSLQTGLEIKKFGVEFRIGSIVALAMTREMGPMMMGIILAGRVGSSLAAEVGTMKVSEEIDALETMSIDPLKFLVFPRLMALMIMGPVLAIYCMGMGVVGGAVVAKYLIGVDYDAYWFWADQSLRLMDVMQGVVKGFVFAIEICVIGCVAGLSASGGAEGVGRQTRNAVVICLMAIIASNFMMSSFFSRF